MFKVSFEHNFDEPEIKQAAIQQMKEIAVDRMLETADQIAAQMQRLGKKVKPEITRSGDLGVEIAIRKPKEIEIAKKRKVVETVWPEIPFMLNKY